LAFETLGPWSKQTIDFINVIGELLIAESGDSKSKKLLFERISFAIQRGNAASIRALFQIPHYYRKFLYFKTKLLCTVAGKKASHNLNVSVIKAITHLDFDVTEK
jgi:hypothetical protein